MLKDERLHQLIQRGVNVAQFVSFGPPGEYRFHGIHGLSSQNQFQSIEQAVDALFAASFIKSVDIRTFLERKPDGNPFEKDVQSKSTASEFVRRFRQEG